MTSMHNSYIYIQCIYICVCVCVCMYVCMYFFSPEVDVRSGTVALLCDGGSVGLSASEEIDEDFRVVGIVRFFFSLFDALGHCFISGRRSLSRESEFLWHWRREFIRTRLSRCRKSYLGLGIMARGVVCGSLWCSCSRADGGLWWRWHRLAGSTCLTEEVSKRG